MRTKELDTLSPELVRRLNPTRVQEYARSTGWRHEPRLGKGQTAVYERPESRLKQFSIPLNRELKDFDLLMARAVAVLADFEERPSHELLADLLLPEADVLRFQESSPASVAGDIPFDRGLSLLQGARKSLLASACSVIRPAAFHLRMSLTDADQFLQRCRLGQTERGSFVLTVACPLDAVPSDQDLFDTPPFTRRVTALLMRSLHRLAGALELGDSDAVLRQADDEPILSANLCEGLLDMQPEGEEAFLRISADFSATVPSNREVAPPRAVRLTREMFPRIESLIGRLRPVQAPRRQLLVGFVETLNGRPNTDGRMEGQVTLRLMTADSDNLRARTDLAVDDYALADQAHMGNRPVSLEGVLRQAGRSYRIDSPARFQILTQTTSSETPS